ncbi:hypothetical protein [Steroidobacter sp.]|uniref:hypothetical protein n=1 Tax=Steroidobacter sp. TaxID=1978227 RepID=UPI001A4C41C7|nr:hypothetical protein [Steroidobacter sp.]MBL8269335.1 hypothetical protein [Steroidobacter sp.]
MRMTNVYSNVLKAGTLLACSLLAACGSKTETTASTAPAASEPAAAVASGPAFALITVPVDATPPADYDVRIASLRAAPGIANVLVLQTQPNSEPPGFKSLAVVEFKDEASLETWLSGDGAREQSGVKVRRADVLAHDASDNAASTAANSYYVVNHYEALISPAEYKTYTEKYVVPNMAHQKSTGAMLGYTMYIEREPASVKPNAVLVKQYVSPEEHVRAEAAKDVFKRDVLMKQAEWKQINDTKATMRNDLTETLAVPLS